MTYVEFLVIFLAAPLGAVLLLGGLDRRLLLTLTTISLVAVLYTGPWDNALILNGVWSYGTGHVMGALIGHVPLEEYCFYVLQVFLTGLVTIGLMRRGNVPD